MHPPYRNAVLIHNPFAGRERHRREAQLALASSLLERAGIAIRLDATAEPGHGQELARAAVQAGADLILACGGDGTLNEVINGMAGSSVPLAVLPGGTANGLARELGLPLDIVGAARRILTAQPRRIPLGRVKGRYFASMVGVGFDAQVVAAVKSHWKSRLGMVHYGLEAVRQAIFGGFTPFRISAEDRCLEATLAVISRARYYGPFRMIPEADLFSDQFTVYCFPSRRLSSYLRCAAALFAGTLGRVPDIISFRAQTVRCEPCGGSGPEIGYQLDGELAGTLPITAEVVPDALTLLVPTAEPRA